MPDNTDGSIEDMSEVSVDSDLAAIRAVNRPSRRNVKRITRRTKTLSTMPLDVAFEIFMYLTPADLVNISRTAKCLRNWLLCKTFACPIWKTALKSIEGPLSPGCPPNLSEPEWANLIWGGNLCHECGQYRSNTIIFIFMARVCRRCSQKLLVLSHELDGMDVKHEPEALKLIPRITADDIFRFPDYVLGRFCAAPEIRSTPRGIKAYYWYYDVVHESRELRSLKKAIKKGKPGAQTALDDYRDYKRQQVKDIEEHALRAREWYRTMTNLKWMKARQGREQRRQDIEDRLLQEGWEQKDVEKALFMYSSRSTRPLSDASWKRISPILVTLLKTAKHNRLEEEYLASRDRLRRNVHR